MVHRLGVAVDDIEDPVLGADQQQWSARHRVDRPVADEELLILLRGDMITSVRQTFA